MPIPDPRRRNLRYLVLGQTALNTGVFLHVFLGAFAVQRVTGSVALGGLPFAIYFFVSLFVTVPAGRWMDRVGRAAVLGVGHVLAAAGAAVIAGSLVIPLGAATFPLLVTGLFLLAAGWSVAGLTRVAAADLYSTEERATGVGRFLLLGLVGHVAGAVLFLLLAREEAIPVTFGYLAVVPVYGIGALSMAAIHGTLPRPARAAARQAPLGSVVRRPRVGWTITSNVGANGGMVGIMSLASPALAALQGPTMVGIMLAHFGGMFLPSPVAGRLADRRGRSLSILVGGGVLLIGALLFSRTDLPLVAGAGLFLVGAGWCFTFIPGTALLADATSLEERGLLFGINDAIVAIVGGAAVLLAGFAFAYWNSWGLALVGASLAALPLIASLRLRPRATRGR